MSRRGRPRHPETLTPRQQEVLELVRQGYSNPQIGRELGISTDGAKFHVSEIITRLGVRTRREAAEWRREERSPAATLRLARFAWRRSGASGRGRRCRHGYVSRVA